MNTKEKILVTALRLFAVYGYEAVSVSRIAGELGITKGALYKHYKNIVINKGDSFMLYQTNPNLEYIQTDEHSKVAFDPDNKTTFFLDEVSQDILEVMKEPKTLENIVEELSKIYDAPKEEISNDVEIFLTDAITKNLVVTK